MTKLLIMFLNYITNSLQSLFFFHEMRSLEGSIFIRDIDAPLVAFKQYVTSPGRVLKSLLIKKLEYKSLYGIHV